MSVHQNDNVIDLFFGNDSDKQSKEPKASSTEEASTKAEETVGLVITKSGQVALFGDDAVTEEAPASSSLASSTAPTTPDSSIVKSKKTHSAAKSSTTTGSTMKKKKDQNIEVNADWTIHVATHSFKVTDFINPMPPSGKVSLETLRMYMEREFPEMTKARVTWDYDKDKKQLYPDVSGTSKG
ncbi:hypothetical protein ABEV55_18385 [Aneurinibacillus thermoaerophilus]|uniref:hypothetical protein n=1 Tax=Aneurinibacillus thermoaerophilus TaxID=143495 RepID=UPI002E1DDF16|nr:hypothetical protein [Aneurinibacillus thermoaerophilus]